MKDESKFAGMTVNERLYVSGNLPKFENAVKERDVEEVVKILMQVELNTTAIEPILKELGLK